MVTHAPPHGIRKVETFQTPLQNAVFGGWTAPHTPLEQHNSHPHTGF